MEKQKWSLATMRRNVSIRSRGSKKNVTWCCLTNRRIRCAVMWKVEQTQLKCRFTANRFFLLSLSCFSSLIRSSILMETFESTTKLSVKLGATQFSQLKQIFKTKYKSPQTRLQRYLLSTDAVMVSVKSSPDKRGFIVRSRFHVMMQSRLKRFVEPTNFIIPNRNENFSVSRISSSRNSAASSSDLSWLS